MADEQNTLRQAIDRILGTSPGGGTGSGGGWGTGGKSPQESAVQMPVRDAASNISAQLETPTAYDPMAESQAAFDKQMAELKAWSPAGATTAAAAAPAAAAGNPWDLPAATPTISKGQYYDPKTGQIWVGDMWGSTAGKPMQMVNPTNINDPGVYRTVDWALGERQKAGYTAESDPATKALQDLYATASSQAQKQAFEDYGKYYYSAPGQTGGPGAKPAAPGGQQAADQADALRKVSTDASGKPINPGPKAPWQKSAQYWKDLENYNKSMGIKR